MKIFISQSGTGTPKNIAKLLTGREAEQITQALKVVKKDLALTFTQRGTPNVYVPNRDVQSLEQDFLIEIFETENRHKNLGLMTDSKDRNIFYIVDADTDEASPRRLGALFTKA